MYLESAVIGEIGNNTFDHNWDFDAKHLRGTYFTPYFKGKYVILADYGNGILSTIKKVSDATTDIEALKLAFTRQISGRAPEMRGNGLSFILDTIKSKNWTMYFQSGNACCIIDRGAEEFKTVSDKCIGCFVIINFKREEDDSSSK